MMRRGDPCSRRDGSTATFSPLSVPGLLYDFDASLGVTVATGVSQWTDQVSGVTATQAAGGAQPTHSSSDSMFNGHASITFDGTNDYLACTNAASAWNFMHNGTGGTCFVVLAHSSVSASQFYLGTSQISTYMRGFGIASQFGGSPTSGWFDVYVGNGTTMPQLRSTTVDSHVGLAAAYQCVVTSGTTPLTVTSYASEQSGTPVSASSFNASASDCQAPLNMGKFGLGSTYAALRTPRILFWNRALSAAEVARIASWATSTYGARS